MDDNKNALYTDYLKRKLILTEQNFLKHTGVTESPDQDKYVAEQRHLLFDKITEVINSPSEVYLHQYAAGSKQQLKYLKHYKEETLVVIGDFDKSINQNLELITWYKNTIGNKNRKGWLIKK